MVFRQILVALSPIISLASAQFPPTPEGITVLKSKFHENITISYKEPGLCETTPGVKSYAGYVHLPVDALDETFEHNQYPLNTFYWFFEARHDPHNAPLVIWLNGGPGGSSLIGALSENGPCFVANDSRTTFLNKWSWNNEANLLIIDQPNQVGYSFDVLTNVTLNQADDTDVASAITPTDFSQGIPEQNATFQVGTMASQKVKNTSNSTQHAATALWHFAQTWFEEFPHYKPHDERINLFTESYGGRYGPGIMKYWLQQNEMIANGTISQPGAHYLHLSTLGIINGCINAPDTLESLIEFAHNNTYGIEAITEEQYAWAIHEFHKSGGALDDIQECRRLQKTTDRYDHGAIGETNRVCRLATDRGENITNGMFIANGRNARFDITHEITDPFPPPYLFGWLNRAEVQKAFGVPVNHSWYSPAVSQGFENTGDYAKGGQLEQLAYVLEHGVNVVLFHGDRDYACNWIGGEKTSLKIPWSSREAFGKAGYAPISLSYPYTQPGGLTRQHGNLSFARVYQAGHMVPSYQPEVAYEIFMRAIKRKDIATGKIDITEYAEAYGKEYATVGPSDTWHIRNDVLPQPPHECYVLNLGDRCTREEKGWIFDGTAIIKDWILIGRDETVKPSTMPKGPSGSLPKDAFNAQHPLLGDW